MFTKTKPVLESTLREINGGRLKVWDRALRTLL